MPTKRRRDYAELEQRALRLVESGCSENAAAEQIADELEIENSESVARNLRRRLARRTRPASIPPGSLILLQEITERIESLGADRRKHWTSRALNEAADRNAAAIQRFLESRLALLDSADRASRGALLHLSNAGAINDPESLILRERMELDRMLQRLKNVRGSISERLRRRNIR